VKSVSDQEDLKVHHLFISLFLLISDDNESEDVTDVLTKGLQITSLVLVDGITDFLVDALTIVEKVLTNVEGKALWVLERKEHLFELLDLVNIFLLRAFTDGGRNGGEG